MSTQVKFLESIRPPVKPIRIFSANNEYNKLEVHFQVKMNLKNEKILVTGADGFIGSHLTEELISRGHDVRAFVFYNSFNSWGWLDSFPKETLDKIEVFAGDIRDPNGVRKAMQGIDIVFHLAAHIAYSDSEKHKMDKINIFGTQNVIQACLENKITHR